MEADKDTDWKPLVEKESEGLIDAFKELYNHEKWTPNGNKPCDMFKMEVDKRMATKGSAVVNYSYEKVV